MPEKYAVAAATASAGRTVSITWRERRPEIPALTGVRAVAAVLVVLYHYSIHPVASTFVPDRLRFALAPAGLGFLGVDLFFILSGFILAYNYWHRIRTGGPRGYVRFLVLRLARIYPV